MPPKKRQPPKSNPAVTIELREQCKVYLEETPYSEWKFTDFWKSDNLSGYGEVWLRALMAIIRTTDNDNRRAAAIEAKDKYKQGEHQVLSKRRSKRLKESQRPELPPSYQGPPQSSQRSQERESSTEEPPQKQTPAVKPYNFHEQHHQALFPERKWYLPSGKCVEDALFALATSQSEEARRLKRIPKESYAHSYILDVDDPVVQAEFRDGWDFIISHLLPLPVVEDSLVSFMHKFAVVKTTTDLRNRLATVPYLLPGETYSSDKHGDQAWVHSVLNSLAVLYEFNHMPHTKNLNLEAWFQINIWGPIFDRCFQYIPKMSIIRSESQSPCNSSRKNSASSDRKNVTNANINDPTCAGPTDPSNPEPTDSTKPNGKASTNSSQKSLASERKIIGSKYDGIIIHNQIEYGAVEDSKEFDTETSKKWVSDSLKLAKVLHDQLRGLEGKVKHDREALGKFQCAGFLTAGLHCQGLFLQYAKGHVSLLQRSAKYEVPKDLSPMSDLIGVLVVVWQMREAVKRSIDSLEEFIESNAEMLFRVAVQQLPPLPDILPMCFDTDAGF